MRDMEFERMQKREVDELNRLKRYMRNSYLRLSGKIPGLFQYLSS